MQSILKSGTFKMDANETRITNDNLTRMANEAAARE
jgi:hypothetical protein